MGFLVHPCIFKEKAPQYERNSSRSMGYTLMDLYQKVYSINAVFGIWHYSQAIRITYVSQGWLVVWDHQQTPPTRYDCQGKSHQDACASAVQIVRRLAIN